MKLADKLKEIEDSWAEDEGPAHADIKLLLEICRIQGEALEGADIFLCERIIDPCGYDPEKESQEELVDQVKALSRDNERMLTELRQALAEIEGLVK